MIQTIIKAMYSAFISIVLISIIMVVWTGFSYVSQPYKSSEITKVIQEIYSSQKSSVINVIELSKILIKDDTQRIDNENSNFIVKTEAISDQEEISQLEQSQITEENVDNPLGIVIEPSSSDISENLLTEIIEETLPNEENEFPKNDMDIDVNS